MKIDDVRMRYSYVLLSGKSPGSSGIGVSTTHGSKQIPIQTRRKERELAEDRTVGVETVAGNGICAWRNLTGR